MTDEATPPDDDGDDAARLGGMSESLWEICPVLCLGQREGNYFFISAAGELRVYGLRDFTATGLLSLFDGSREWLAKQFPGFDREGKRNSDFTNKTAVAGLMGRCAAGGLWNDTTPIRGVGVWRGAKPDDPVVVHCGDQLLVVDGDGHPQWMPAGRKYEGAIYPAAPPIDRPLRPLPSDEDIRGIETALKLWNFDDPTSPRLLLGFIALAALGAAPEWRVHVLLTGARGDGKTTLARFIRRLLGAQAAALNDFTEAGLRQTFTRAALAYILDEAEGDIQFNRIDLVIQFLRRMTGEEGLQSVRGSAGGHAQQFSASSPALLSAINPPAMLPQDRSRFLTVELAPADKRNRDAVKAALVMAERLSPGFRAFAIAGWPRFRANLVLYHAALMESGCDPRQADKYGALLAAADMMHFDEPIDSEAAAGAVANISDLIAETILEDEEASDSQQCLTRLMTRQIEHWRGGSKSTIGRLVSDVLADQNNHESEKALRVYGLRLMRLPLPDGNKVWWLFVANQHEGLSTIFDGTRWRAGAWKTALLRLPDAEKSHQPVRFDGTQARAVGVPEKLLPTPPRRNGPAPPGRGEFDDPFGDDEEQPE